jgi:flagellar basal-body rod protein FlgC
MFAITCQRSGQDFCYLPSLVSIKSDNILNYGGKKMKAGVLLLFFTATISFASKKESTQNYLQNKNLNEVEFCKLMKNKEMEMEVISSSIENINTTNTPEGGPYKAKKLICSEKLCAVLSYKNVISRLMPGHPDADSNGYVRFPDIDLQAEMRSMIEARSTYELAARNCKSKRVM